MLTKTRLDLEPMDRLRRLLPPSYLETFELLVGSVPMPWDQASCASVMTTLANCLLAYTKELEHLRSDFRGWMLDIEFIAEITTQHELEIQGRPPAGQLASRVSEFPAWALLMELRTEQVPLRVALGAEVALALLDRRQLHECYCIQLRRDCARYGRPQPGEVRQVEDLAELGFGKGWLARFNKIDRQVRRRVEIPDPDGPSRPYHANPRHALDLLARIRWRFEYVDPKHRQAAVDDSHLPLAQYCRASHQIRNDVVAGQTQAIVQALCLVTRLPPNLATSLPLVSANHPCRHLGVDVAHGTLVLDLRSVFPNRRKPSEHINGLFHKSSDLLAVPMPHFLAVELRRLALSQPNARLLGDLLNWVHADLRTSLVREEKCKLRSSLARSAKSTGTTAIATGVDRLVAACLNWDFSLVGSARLYYARLTGRDIHTGASTLYAAIGWGQPAISEAALEAVGSQCTLTHDGLQTVLQSLAQATTEAAPARRATLTRLLTHHARYTAYTVTLASFCLGLRQVRAYRLLTADLLNGNMIVVHDKQGGNPLMAQPAVINRLVREQIQLYISHCKALVPRLEKTGSQEGLNLSQALIKALNGEGYLFLVQRPDGAVRPAGAGNVWDQLPKEIRVPANVGRHFWQNTLREHGLQSRDIDRFMRHRVVGLESGTSSQLASPMRSFERIERVQLQVLSNLGIRALPGLRRV